MFTLEDLSIPNNYRVTESQKEEIIEHSNKFGIKPVICAWYSSLDDFYSDWMGIGYSEYEVDMVLSREDEFIEFDDGSIVRFVI